MDTPDIVVVDGENLNPKRAHPDDPDTENVPDKKRRLSSKVKKDPAEVEKKLKEKEGAQKKREAEKQEREEQKLKKKLEHEERQRKIEEQKLKKKLEHEERQRKRDEQKELKRQEQEERQKQREEQKKRLDEETGKKRKDKEEMEKKKERQAAAFKNFFVKVKTDEPKTLGWSNSLFLPFEVKANMSVARLSHREPLSKEAYDNLFLKQLEKADCLAALKKIKRNRIVKDPVRAKYFHFHDNFRPPYYGTWRKTSKRITGRRPFVLSHRELNYDIDSDAEWEEEQAEGGDDCLSDVDDGCKEDSNGSTDDFYVDHGYLSENEGSEASNSNDNENSDQRRRRLDHRVDEFTKQRSNKIRRTKKPLTVQIYGLNWRPSDSNMRDLEKYLLKAVIFDFPKVAEKQ